MLSKKHSHPSVKTQKSTEKSALKEYLFNSESPLSKKQIAGILHLYSEANQKKRSQASPLFFKAQQCHHSRQNERLLKEALKAISQNKDSEQDMINESATVTFQ
ncbi:MAG: hypothetical protein PSV35_07990 [bacterium]|nr:hypothetical protein [bacterium]